MITEPRGFGYRPDPIDTRDHRFAAPAGLTRIADRRMDLLIAYIRDQLSSSSCVGQAWALLIELCRAVEGHPTVRLSAMHAYLMARMQDGFHEEDAGAFIRSGAKAITKVGVCSETEWPLDLRKINARPPLSAEISGVKFADLAYQRVFGGAEGVLDALQMGRPCIFGTLVGNVFVDHVGEDTIPAPGPREVMLGGHALVAAGFDRHGERIRIANSWGRGWGDNGFAWMQAEWFDLSATQDIWCVVPRTETTP